VITEYADRLFGVLRRLQGREEIEGIGVGLAAVARIVQKHRGRNCADAEKDPAAAVYFTLSTATAT